MRKVRGLRYCVGSIGKEIRRFVEKDLPYQDFDETNDFYDMILADDLVKPRDLAFLGCNDRFFLLTRILRRIDAINPWLFNRCREVEARPEGRIDLWARYHYKSTIITFAGSIQEIVCDPNITISIFSVTKPIACAFLAQIKDELEGNEFLKGIYSDVFYRSPRTKGLDGRPSKWSIARGLTVKRTSNKKEATVEAHGLIDGQPTSRHFDLHVYDDVVTQDYLAPEQIQKTTQRWEMADNLATKEGARKWIAGTRYSIHDTYGEMIIRKVAVPRIHAATDNGKLNGNPVFLTKERWEEIKRIQRSTVSSQMLLNPLAGTEATFHSTWFKTYQIVPGVMNVYIMVDPSKGDHDRSDRTAIAVIGIDPANNKYFLDGVRHRMKLSERYRWLCLLRDKWIRHEGVQMVRVGYERYGMQTDLETIEEYMQRDKNYFKIEELNTPKQGPHSKDDRIERLEPDMKHGFFYMPMVVYHADFIKETHGRGLWFSWTEEHAKEAEANSIESTYVVGQIVYRALRGMTKLQRSVSPKRAVEPIRRIDENGGIYDVTRSLIEELISHPAGKFKDLIDATSRIYDMEPMAPSIREQVQTAPAEDGGDSVEFSGLGIEDDFGAIEDALSSPFGYH